MPWLLNLAYGLLLITLSPVLVYRVFVLKKSREGFAEKLLGRLPRRTSERPCTWFHAVSVGEVLQLQPVVRSLEESRPDEEIWITCTTPTGLAVAQEKFPRHPVSYFPLDFSWAVRNAIERVKPSAIVLVELELWPNFINAAHQAGVPLALINGRISEKSFRGYYRIRFLMRRMLRRFDLLAVQSETYGQRLIELGAPPGCVHVTGSIKFDGVTADRQNPHTQELREAFGLRAGEPVFIAGSTQDPEETYAIQTYQTLRTEFPTLRLILVPRHKERFEEVARLVEQRGLPLLRRSAQKGQRGKGAEGQRAEQQSEVDGLSTDKGPRTTDQSPILLLDTLGELAACWGLADVAFVGGSLTNRGGQNVMEPSAYGAAVLFGPNTKNFRDVVELLLSHQAAQVVADAEALTNQVRHWLARPDEAVQSGSRAQQLVLSQQGATARTLELLGSSRVEGRESRVQSQKKNQPARKAS